MYDDVECPYCNKVQEIKHDDGYGYDESALHQQDCNDCGKTFTYRTDIIFSHEAFKADCLNGSPHIFKQTVTYPKNFTMMRCVGCDEERTPTEEEMKTIMENNK